MPSPIPLVEPVTIAVFPFNIRVLPGVTAARRSWPGDPGPGRGGPQAAENCKIDDRGQDARDSDPERQRQSGAVVEHAEQIADQCAAGSLQRPDQRRCETGHVRHRLHRGGDRVRRDQAHSQHINQHRADHPGHPADAQHSAGDNRDAARRDQPDPETQDDPGPARDAPSRELMQAPVISANGGEAEQIAEAVARDPEYLDKDKRRTGDIGEQPAEHEADQQRVTDAGRAAEKIEQVARQFDGACRVRVAARHALRQPRPGRGEHRQPDAPRGWRRSRRQPSRSRIAAAGSAPAAAPTDMIIVIYDKI